MSDPDYRIPYRNHWDQRHSHTTVTVSPGSPRRKQLTAIAWSLFAGLALAFALIAIGGLNS